jgi:hypothetical protein
MVKFRKRMQIRRYMSIPALIDTLRRKKLAILNPDSWDDKNDKLFMKVYKDHTGAKGLYGLCAALRAETYHHWKIFGGGASGACAVLKRGPLEAHLDLRQADPGTKIRYGEVKYLRLPEVQALTHADIERIPFVKRYGFKDEDEYRIIVETTERQQPALFINCPLDWIETVYLNPWLYENQAESLIETIEAIPGCEDLDIRLSQLTDSTTWREAADRIAEKPVLPDLTLEEAGKVKPKRRLVLKKAPATGRESVSPKQPRKRR